MPRGPRLSSLHVHLRALARLQACVEGKEGKKDPNSVHFCHDAIFPSHPQLPKRSQHIAIFGHFGLRVALGLCARLASWCPLLVHVHVLLQLQASLLPTKARPSHDEDPWSSTLSLNTHFAFSSCFFGNMKLFAVFCCPMWRTGGRRRRRVHPPHGAIPKIVRDLPPRRRKIGIVSRRCNYRKDMHRKEAFRWTYRKYTTAASNLQQTPDACTYMNNTASCESHTILRHTNPSR